MNRAKWSISSIILIMCLTGLIFCLFSKAVFADVVYFSNGNLLNGLIIEVDKEVLFLQTPLGVLKIPQTQIRAIEKKDYPAFKFKSYPASQKQGLWEPLEADSVGSIVLEISRYEDLRETDEYLRMYLERGEYLFASSLKTRDELIKRITLLKAVNCYEIVRYLSLDYKIKWDAQKKIDQAQIYLKKQIKLPDIDCGYDSERIISEIIDLTKEEKNKYAKQYMQTAEALEVCIEKDSSNSHVYLKVAAGCYYICARLTSNVSYGQQAQKGYKRCSLKMLRGN